MKSVNLEEIKHVAMFFEKFGRQLGVVIHLVTGGYPRDIALGRKPKDIDVLIKSNLCEEDLINEVKRIASQKLAQVEFTVFTNYGADCNHFSENYIVGLHVAVRDMLPIDLLFVKGSKISKTINSFDCSLNKGVLNEDGTIAGLDLDHFVYTGICIERFRRFVDMYTGLLEKKKNQKPVENININIFGE